MRRRLAGFCGIGGWGRKARTMISRASTGQGALALDTTAVLHGPRMRSEALSGAVAAEAAAEGKEKTASQPRRPCLAQLAAARRHCHQPKAPRRTCSCHQVRRFYRAPVPAPAPAPRTSSLRGLILHLRALCCPPPPRPAPPARPQTNCGPDGHPRPPTLPAHSSNTGPRRRSGAAELTCA